MRAGLVVAAATCLVAGCGTAASPAVRTTAAEHRPAPRLAVTRTYDYDVPGSDVGIPVPAADGDILMTVSPQGQERRSVLRMLRPDGRDTIVARTSTRRGEIESTAYADGWVAWVDQLRVGQNLGDGDPKPWRLMVKDLASGKVRTLGSGTAAPGSFTPELSGDGKTFYWSQPDRAHTTRIMSWSTAGATRPAVLARHLRVYSTPSVAGGSIVYLGAAADGSRFESTGDCYALATRPKPQDQPRLLTATNRAVACTTNGSDLVFELQHPPRGPNDGPPENNPWQVRSQALSGSPTSTSTVLEQGYLPGEQPVAGGEFTAFTTLHGSHSVEVASLSAKRSSVFAAMARKQGVRWLAARGRTLFVVSQDDDLHVHATFFTVD